MRALASANDPKRTFKVCAETGVSFGRLAMIQLANHQRKAHTPNRPCLHYKAAGFSLTFMFI
jgi:hypothetical protein